jgi:integrase
MSAPLRLVPTLRAEPAHPLIALTDGAPVLAGDADTDLVDFVNTGTRVLEPTTDPDTVTPATMQLAWFVHHVGDTHRTGGDRSDNLASHIGRWVLPFLIELAHTKPQAERGVADLWVAEAEALTRILAGAQPMPAATVAGDLLGRRALACVWLGILDAGNVCHGGAQAVTDAIAHRRLVTHRDHAGHVLVHTADLRGAGLLIEKDTPHGVCRDHAGNVLFPFKQAMTRAANLGAHLRGNFEALRPITPLDGDLARPGRDDPGYIPLDAIHALGSHLTPVHQVVLWLLRLMGLRIGEAYGLLVSDLAYDADAEAWTLAIAKQGGRRATVRNTVTGKLERRDSKPDTKTPQSHRTVRVPDHLARTLCDLVAIFHTDEDGTVDTRARLIPGLRKDDATGADAFRHALDRAIARAGVPRFRPHDLRGSLITDLKNAGVKKRIRTYYAGHAKKGSVHDGYDDGVPVSLQLRATRVLDQLLAELNLDQLVVATEHQQSWGRDTRTGRRADSVRRRLRERGWEATPEGFAPDDVVIDTAEAARMLGVSVVEMRRRFASGEVRAARVMRGKRPVWLTTVRDLQDAADNDAATTLKDLAETTGLTYHQARTLCIQTGVLDPTADRGTRVRLTGDQVAQVLDEIARRDALSKHVMDLPAASRALNLPLGQVEKLYRSKRLERAPDPVGRRRRFVTRASVEAYAASVTIAPAQPGDRYVPLGIAAECLQVTRHELSEAMSSGSLRATTISRRQHVSLTDALSLAEQQHLGETTTTRLVAYAVPHEN